MTRVAALPVILQFPLPARIRFLARMRHASKIQDATLQRTRAARGNGNNDDNNNNRAWEISVALPHSWKVPFPLSSSKRKKKRRNKSESFQESDGGYRDRLFYVSLIFFFRWNYENGGGRVWI